MSFAFVAPKSHNAAQHAYHYKGSTNQAVNKGYRTHGLVFLRFDCKGRCFGHDIRCCDCCCWKKSNLNNPIHGFIINPYSQALHLITNRIWVRHLKVLKLYFHSRASWNRNWIIALHFVWIAFRIVWTFQSIIHHWTTVGWIKQQQQQQKKRSYLNIMLSSNVNILEQKKKINVEKSLNPTGLIWAFTLPSLAVITNLAVTLCKNVQLTSQWSTYRFSRKWGMSFHYTIRHSISQLERVRHTSQTKSHRPVHSRTV